MPDTEVPKDAPDETPETETTVQVDVPETTDEADGNTREDLHPLEPGGDRFKQVWARTKRAEAAAAKLREEKIALETELRVRKEVVTTTKTPEVFTNVQLEAAIERGEITRAQKDDYRDAQLVQQAAREGRAAAAQEFKETTRVNHVVGELDRYAKAVPALLDTTTAERAQVEDEYAWLVSLHGTPKLHSPEQRAMELTAVRTVFGSVESIEKKRGLDRVARESREGTQETMSGRAATAVVVDGPPKGMSPQMIEHYTNMFKKSNDYPGRWKDVQTEITEYTKRTGKKLW